MEPADKRKVEARLRRVANRSANAAEERDEAIVFAAADGLSYRRIAELTGLTFGRVGQIVRGE